MGKMFKVHQKRRDPFISVCLNKGKYASFNNGYCYTVAQWVIFSSVYIHIFIALLKTRGKLLTSKSVQAAPEWTNS